MSIGQRDMTDFATPPLYQRYDNVIGRERPASLRMDLPATRRVVRPQSDRTLNFQPANVCARKHIARLPRRHRQLRMTGRFQSETHGAHHTRCHRRAAGPTKPKASASSRVITPVSSNRASTEVLRVGSRRWSHRQTRRLSGSAVVQYAWGRYQTQHRRGAPIRGQSDYHK